VRREDVSSTVSETATTAPSQPRLTTYAWLSIAAAVVTIALKTGAYLLTGSVGLLSDAAESVVNLVAAVIALVALTVAARPADHSHHYGHGKAEYFSAAIEGLMIFVAAAFIIVSAILRLIHPQPLESLGIGLLITLLATAVNGVVGVLLLRVGREHRSATLVADGKHLLTDVWTSVGVVVGVGAVALTGWLPLDSLVAIAVALNILVTGSRLVASSTSSLLDAALPQTDVALVTAVLDRHRTDLVDFHGLQTRASGRTRFVSFHVLVPGGWTIQQGHDLLEAVEDDVRAALEGVHVTTHLEPREDARAYEDYAFDGIPPQPGQPAECAAGRPRERRDRGAPGLEQRVGQCGACLGDARVRLVDEGEQGEQVVACGRALVTRRAPHQLDDPAERLVHPPGQQLDVGRECLSRERVRCGVGGRERLGGVDPVGTTQQ
jgi:cation diffusion facilitator family transporter